MLHGRRDELIPPSHAERLATAASARLIWYDTAHNDPPDTARYRRDIERFLRDSRVLD